MIWDASDANPMHRRIPAEVVSRRARPEKRKPQEPEKVVEEVVVDLKAVTNLKPEARQKWLAKAFKMVSEGNASCTELYNIIVSRKFASGLSERVARKLVAVVRESQELFSDKQQRYLNSTECPLMALLSSREADAVEEEGATAARENAASAETDAADQALAAIESRRSRPGEDRERRSFGAVMSSRTSSSRLPLKMREEDSNAAAGWQVAEDEAARRRQAALAEEERRKEAKRKAEQKRKQEAEDEAARQRAAEEEAERKRKLEEEADDIFMRALESKPATTLALRDGTARKRSRSRSISSRTARRNNRRQTPKTRDDWFANGRGPSGGIVSGSRAIFLNKDFVEDLPHMPRPVAPGILGVGGARSPSRPQSRSRSRERERIRDRDRDRERDRDRRRR